MPALNPVLCTKSRDLDLQIVGILAETSGQRQIGSALRGFQAFLDEWVFGVEDRSEYLQHYISRFGYPAFRKLQAEFDYGYPVSYAY